MGTIQGGTVIPGVARGAPPAVLTKTADYTVTEADNGAVILADAVDLTITLPATRAGFRVTVIVATASATTGLSISPAAADQIIGNGFTPADDKDAVNTAATDAVGDLMTLVGDGADGWYIENIIGTWAREA
jgi:hypothetical protein